MACICTTLFPFLTRFHVGTFGGTTSHLLYLRNPGQLSSDAESWTHWEETVLVEGGPDVYFEMVTLNDDQGVEYSALVAGKRTMF